MALHTAGLQYLTPIGSKVGSGEQESMLGAGAQALASAVRARGSRRASNIAFPFFDLGSSAVSGLPLPVTPGDDQDPHRRVGDRDDSGGRTVIVSYFYSTRGHSCSATFCSYLF